jgi:hypothetical protein
MAAESEWDWDNQPTPHFVKRARAHGCPPGFERVYLLVQMRCRRDPHRTLGSCRERGEREPLDWCAPCAASWSVGHSGVLGLRRLIEQAVELVERNDFCCQMCEPGAPGQHRDGCRVDALGHALLDLDLLYPDDEEPSA